MIEESLIALKGATIMTAIILAVFISLVVEVYGLTIGVTITLLVTLPIGAAVIWLLFVLIESAIKN